MNRCSSGKVSHEDKKSAQSMVNHINKGNHRPDKKLRIYQCEICKLWHLSSHDDPDGGRVRPVLLHHAKEFSKLITKRTRSYGKNR